MANNRETYSLRTVVRRGRLQRNAASERTPTGESWYDVKFYPYIPPGASPVFAVVGGNNILICRCLPNDEDPIEIIKCYEHEDMVTYHSVDWSCASNGDPLVCATGNDPRINIINIKTDETTTLLGHGQAINDLAISPAEPSLLASASDDYSIRIWNLDEAHKRHPTAAILLGAGHKQQVLAVGWHRKGQYLLSGGMDTSVNLWMLPDRLHERPGTDKPPVLHYPHFSSTEVHTDYVDCIRFYNDVIISHAAKEHKIILWRIDDFKSNGPAPDSVPIPPSQTVKSNEDEYTSTKQAWGTRSAWGGRFQRLLQFDLPEAELFYLRFGLHHGAGTHPILVAGNQNSTMFLWDLENLEEAGTGNKNAPAKTTNEKDAPLSGFLARSDTPSTTSSVPSSVRGIRSGSSASTIDAEATPPKKIKVVKKAKKPDNRVTGIGDPLKSITAHQKFVISKQSLGIHQVSFSPDGEWCVSCGDTGIIAVLRRDKTG